VGPRVGPVEVDVARLDGQPAACGHGIAGVDRQVHQHLLHLAGVGLDATQRRVQGGRQADVLADHPAQERHQAGHHHVEVEYARLQHLLPAERQELPRQGGGPVRRVPDGLHRRARRDGRRQVLQQVAVAHDDGEQVVEVVGHPGGQPTHRLHLLRLRQLPLQPLALLDLAAQGRVGPGQLGGPVPHPPLQVLV